MNQSREAGVGKEVKGNGFFYVLQRYNVGIVFSNELEVVAKVFQRGKGVGVNVVLCQEIGVEYKVGVFADSVVNGNTISLVTNLSSSEQGRVDRRFERFTFVVELFVKSNELAVGSKFIILVVASYEENIKSGLVKGNFSAVLEHAKNVIAGDNIVDNLFRAFGRFFFLFLGVVLLSKTIRFYFSIFIFNKLLVFVFVNHNELEDYAQTVEQNTVKSKFYLSDSLRCSFFIFDCVEGINFCFNILDDEFACTRSEHRNKHENR